MLDFVGEILNVLSARKTMVRHLQGFKVKKEKCSTKSEASKFLNAAFVLASAKGLPGPEIFPCLRWNPS